MLAGCGTTPGVGIPPVLISGRLAAERITGAAGGRGAVQPADSPSCEHWRDMTAQPSSPVDEPATPAAGGRAACPGAHGCAGRGRTDGARAPAQPVRRARRAARC